MKCLLISALVLSIVIPAHAQIKSGSVVAFKTTPTGLVMAADSRAVYQNDFAPPDQNHCKIDAFKLKHIVFAATGKIEFIGRPGRNVPPDWSVVEDAKWVIAQNWNSPVPANAIDAANTISQLWEQRVLDHWSNLMRLRPDLFNQAVTASSGNTLTSGVFALAYQGKVATVVSLIKYENGSLGISHPDPRCLLMCVMGDPESYMKHSFDPDIIGGSDPMRQVIKVVELTISEDRTGLVGGPVDALELLNDGVNPVETEKGCLP
jgi:hypothetical protein